MLELRIALTHSEGATKEAREMNSICKLKWDVEIANKSLAIELARKQLNEYRERYSLHFYLFSAFINLLMTGKRKKCRRTMI